MIASIINRTFALLLLCIAVATCGPSGLRAQETAQAEDQVALRINHLINASMDQVRSRAAIFNEQVSDINKIDPLSLSHLDSVDIAANIGKVLAFTQFLASFKSGGDSLARSLEDSLFMIKQQSPLIASDKIVTGFATSFNADRTAFDKYVVTLKKLYDNVLTALLFLQHTPYTITKKRLEFVKKQDVEAYQKLMDPIDRTAKELKRASEESQEATKLANKTIAGLNKQSKSTGKKTHKKPSTDSQ